jgi:hypothetical protein
MYRGCGAILLIAVVGSLVADQLMATELKLSGSEPGEMFGSSVSLTTSFVEADRAAVGAPMYAWTGVPSGAAYLLEKDSGSWSGYILADSPDRAHYDLCGFAVKIQYDNAWVGVPGHNDLPLENSGGVAMIHDVGTGWTTPGWQDPVAARTDGARLGYSVDLWGEYGVSGAPFADRSGDSSGAAFVYRDMGTDYSYHDELSAADVASGDDFGTSVAIYSDWTMVGAPGDDDGGADAGAVYVFERSGTSWINTQKLTAPDAAPGDEFGTALAITSWWLAVSAPLASGPRGSFSGTVYLYEKVGDTWVFRDQIWPSNSEAGLFFGSSLALWASNLVVGSSRGYFYGSDSGIVHTFRLSGSEWTEQGWLVAGDLAAGDRFGKSVSIFQTTVMVGSPSDDNSVGTDTGAVYIYDLADFQAHIFSDGFEFGGPWFWSSTVD